MQPLKVRRIAVFMRYALAALAMIFTSILSCTYTEFIWRGTKLETYLITQSLTGRVA